MLFYKIQKHTNINTLCVISYETITQKHNYAVISIYYFLFHMKLPVETYNYYITITCF